MKLAFMGQSGVGKDYIVDILVNKYPYTRVSFSDQLKKLTVKIYPWMEQDYSPEEKELPINKEVNGKLITKTPREIWLKLNVLRDIEDDIFIRMLEEEIQILSNDKIVISDIRTKRELEWCRQNGFTIIAVKSIKPVHPDNKFDDFVRDKIENLDYDKVFINNMNGSGEIIQFIESCV